MCYSDLPYLYTGRGFVELNWPFTDNPRSGPGCETMEYPVGIAYWAFGTAYVTHWLSGSPDIERRYGIDVGTLFGQPDIQAEIRMFVVVNAVGFALLALLATWFLAGVHPGRPWDAAPVRPGAGARADRAGELGPRRGGARRRRPVGVVTGRPVLTGLLLGLGAATKLYPRFLLGRVLVICVRERRCAQLVGVSGSALLAWRVANVPAYLSGPEPWRVFWSFNDERGADLGSIWLLSAQAGDLMFFRTRSTTSS